MKGIIFWGLVGVGIWAASTGRLDSWITQHSLSDRKLRNISCDEVGRVAMTKSLQNAFGARFQILEVSGAQRVALNSNELVCRARALLSNGQNVNLTIKVKESGGRRYYEFHSSL
jgi:hypothetical protein